MVVATPGLVKLRKHQFGRQAAFNTPVAAKRAYPFSGVPTIDLAWTDPEGDFGSVDLIAAPTRGPEELTASLTANAVYYNDWPLMMAAMFGDAQNAAGAGTGKTWTHQPASLTADDLDIFSYEFGDDLDGTGGKPNDWFQLGDGLLESLTVNGPEGLGALTADMSWRFGMARYEGATEAALQPSPAVPTGSLTVDDDGTPIYLGDCILSIDSAFGDIGDTPISDALHSFSMNVSMPIDMKRLANGNGFDISGYTRTARIIEWTLKFAKTADTVGVGSESDAWFSETAINRFVQLEFTSGAVAETGSPDVPYSLQLRTPMRYYTRTDTEVSGNATIDLVGRSYYSADLGYAFKSTVVNTLATASL